MRLRAGGRARCHPDRVAERRRGPQARTNRDQDPPVAGRPGGDRPGGGRMALPALAPIGGGVTEADDANAQTEHRDRRQRSGEVHVVLAPPRLAAGALLQPGRGSRGDRRLEPAGKATRSGRARGSSNPGTPGEAGELGVREHVLSGRPRTAVEAAEGSITGCTIWLDPMHPATMVAATRRMVRPVPVIRSTFALPSTSGRRSFGTPARSNT